MFKTIIAFCTVLLFLSCSQSSSKKEGNTNDLIHETSPYLLKHAHNPVAWKAWNKETLALAKKENKLIIISVGYSACHWCHVMEKESFSNDSVAKIMNKNFINIKVDREERPDVDKVYMTAVKLMTGSAGWPLNCITLPDGKPIFGGTYFTKEEWISVLTQISDLYKNNPKKAIAFAENLTKGVQESTAIIPNTKKIAYKQEIVTNAIEKWKPYLDYNLGGQKGTEKFPAVTNLEFFMRYAKQRNNLEIQNFVDITLTKMAFGGIYDQVGGGFSRYTVDKKWHIPHFEKMLYDNAQLISLYAKAYALTKNELYKTIVEETIAFAAKELLDKSGGFYSSIDANSKNKSGIIEEGAFYSWELQELQALVGEDFTLFKDYYNINNFGLWEDDKYILIRTTSDVIFAKNNNLTLQSLKTKVKQWKNQLLEVRNKREKPNLDSKILSGWNGLMLKGLVDAYKIFKDDNFLKLAKNNAMFLQKHQLKKEGGLYRNFKDDKSTINGYAEDYANVIAGFIALYQVTLEEKWLHTAKELNDYMIQHFYDDKSGMFYFTSSKDELLITKNIDITDAAIASSNSIMATNLFALSHYFANKDYQQKSKKMLRTIAPKFKESPFGYSNWLHLFLSYSDNFYEVAVSGNKAKEKIAVIQKEFIPNILIVGATKESAIPLLENRFNEDETYIYVCVDGTCKLPETDEVKVIEQLSKN